MVGEVKEVDVFEAGFDGPEAIAGAGVGEDADLVQTADEVSGDDVEGGFEGAELVVGGYDLGPDLSGESIESFGGCALDRKSVV